MHLLITYDIADNRRRTRVATLLEGFGVRVNYSVFEVTIRAHKLEKLLAGIRQWCQKGDSVRVYRMSRDTIAKSYELFDRPDPFERESGYVD